MDQDVYNLEAEAKKAAEKEKLERQKDLWDIKKILKIPEGRRLIWRLMSRAGICRNPFDANNSIQSFNSGRMSIGLEILQDINEANPAAFAQMQNEYVSAKKSKQEETDARPE